VRLGDVELWAWCSALEAPEPQALAALTQVVPTAGIRVAAGRPYPEVDGFRRSHCEARDAARVASLAGERAAGVTLYDAVALVSLLSVDLERARAFVRTELGKLAAPQPAMARLRETLLVLLEEGMSN